MGIVGTSENWGDDGLRDFMLFIHLSHNNG